MSNFESSEPNLPSLRSRAREILGNSYESYKSLIADIPLKVQEMLGKISEKDFDKLIEADIKRTFAFSPPIPGKFPFHSREYTKQVSRQVEGMAYYRLIAERIIERNPNVPAEKLSKYLKFLLKNIIYLRRN